jgi:hypothetical protein
MRVCVSSSARSDSTTIANPRICASGEDEADGSSGSERGGGCDQASFMLALRSR